MGTFTVDDAIIMATEAHRGQRDKGRPNLPYITHPMRVMASFDDPVLQMIAVLHDAVEDGPLTLEEIQEAGAPGRVVAGIDAMTHRTGESDDEYWARVRANSDALAVKLVDIEDNSDPGRLKLLPTEVAERLSDKYVRARTALLGTPPIPEALLTVASASGGTVSQFDSRQSHERVVVLQDVVTEGSTKNLSISMDPNGAFRWRGHDSGGDVTKFWGAGISDYEWVYAVPPSRVHKLVAALRGRQDEDVLDLVRHRFEEGVDIPAVLRGEAVGAELSNWHS
ncbi:MAG TPA: hypothetical protein VI316_11615 [Candidatus Dormibacteraeota bacterium]